VPKHAINLKRMIGAHHGVLIVTPEYNSSVPPLVKNTIDWVTAGAGSPEARARCFANARLRSRRRREAGSAEAGLWRRCADSVRLPRHRLFRTRSRCHSRISL